MNTKKRILNFVFCYGLIWIAAILAHAESQQPTLTWDLGIPENCQSMAYNPICEENDGTEDNWDVTITCPDHPDGETDSITVEYSDYPFDQGDRGLERQQLVLQCTGTGENQIQMDVFCLLDASGGGVTAEGPYIFTNLSAAGVLPGWTCTVLGCFSIYKPARGEREYFKAPDVQCTVNSPEEPTKVTTFNATTSSATTSSTTTSSATTSIGTTKTTTVVITTVANDLRDWKDFIHYLTPVMILLILLIGVLLLVFAVLVWVRQLREKRKKALLVFDKQNMIFDPTYTPAVCIDKVALDYTPRLSVVSMDLLHYLQPLDKLDFLSNHGSSLKNGYIDHNIELAVQSSASFKGDDDNCSNLTTVTMDMESCPEEFPGNGGYILEDTPTLMDKNGDQLELRVPGGPGSQTGYTVHDNIMGNQSHVSCPQDGIVFQRTATTTTIAHNTYSPVSQDTFRLSYAKDDLDLDGAGLGSVNLDGQVYSSSSGEYVQPNTSNVPVIRTKFEDNMPTDDIILLSDLDLKESDGQCQSSTLGQAGEEMATGYLDAEQFHLQTLCHNDVVNEEGEFLPLDLCADSLSIDSAVLDQAMVPSVSILRDEKEPKPNNPFSPGYIVDERTPASIHVDKMDSESLDLIFDTERENSSNELKIPDELELPGKLEGEQVSPDVPLLLLSSDTSTSDSIIESGSDTCSTSSETPCLLPASSSNSNSNSTRGYVTCEEIATADLSTTRDIIIPSGLISPSSDRETECGFTVHLDFDDGMKLHEDSNMFEKGRLNSGKMESDVLIKGAQLTQQCELGAGGYLVNDSAVSSLHNPTLAVETEPYLFYDLLPLVAELRVDTFSDCSSIDCEPSAVSKDQSSSTPGYVDPPSNGSYCPSDASSGYMSNSSTVGHDISAYL